MSRTEIEEDSFANAFLGQDSLKALKGRAQSQTYGTGRYADENHIFDYDALAEVPEALNAFIENQNTFDL